MKGTATWSWNSNRQMSRSEISNYLSKVRWWMPATWSRCSSRSWCKRRKIEILSETRYTFKESSLINTHLIWVESREIGRLRSWVWKLRPIVQSLPPPAEFRWCRGKRKNTNSCSTAMSWNLVNRLEWQTYQCSKTQFNHQYNKVLRDQSIAPSLFLSLALANSRNSRVVRVDFHKRCQIWLW